MKHFIGGGAFGFFIGLFCYPVGEGKVAACITFVFLLAIAAWGLLP